MRNDEGQGPLSRSLVVSSSPQLALLAPVHLPNCPVPIPQTSLNSWKGHGWGKAVTTEAEKLLYGWTGSSEGVLLLGDPPSAQHWLSPRAGKVGDKRQNLLSLHIRRRHTHSGPDMAKWYPCIRKCTCMGRQRCRPVCTLHLSNTAHTLLRGAAGLQDKKGLTGPERPFSRPQSTLNNRHQMNLDLQDTINLTPSW